MERFFRLFGVGKPAGWNGRVFLPVIHVKNGDEFETGLAGVWTARAAGADGAFLIEHSGITDYRRMTRVAADIREVLASHGIDFPVGVNYLSITDEPDLFIREAMRLGQIPMIWSDNSEGRIDVEDARRETGWEGVYFGAVAFKYQKIVPILELADVARRATWMDVLTTSGEKTAVSIELDRARVLARAVPEAVRAVASGVTSANIDQLLPYFNAFLVASSISMDFHHLDLEKTQELADAIHRWKSER